MQAPGNSSLLKPCWNRSHYSIASTSFPILENPRDQGLIFIPCSYMKFQKKNTSNGFVFNLTLWKTRKTTLFLFNPIIVPQNNRCVSWSFKFRLYRVIVALEKLHHQCFHTLLIVFIGAPLFLLLLFDIPNWSLTFLVHNQLLCLPQMRKYGF